MNHAMRTMHTWNRAMRGAYLKGLHARLNDQPITDCPYRDIRKPSGKLSWSRAFQNAWRDGWEDADRDQEQALITAAHSKGGSTCE